MLFDAHPPVQTRPHSFNRFAPKLVTLLSFFCCPLVEVDGRPNLNSSSLGLCDGKLYLQWFARKKYGGFHQWGSPKWMVYIYIYETNKIPLKWMIFWGMPNAYVRKPAYIINANICQHASNTSVKLGLVNHPRIRSVMFFWRKVCLADMQRIYQRIIENRSHDYCFDGSVQQK